MQTLSATQARSDLFGLVKNAVKKHQLCRINHRAGDAILISEEDYESLLETMELLSAPNFRKKHRRARKEIREKKTVSFEEVFGQ